jgi:hypothetical protein
MNIKIGDVAMTNRFGTAKITRILLTSGPGCNDGDEVNAIGIESVHAGKAVFDLDNNHWVWSDQILAINNVGIKRLFESIRH